jgi:FkbH-like protein
MIANDVAQSAPKIKCVVWDLDNTIWNGILAENDAVHLRPDALQLIKEFDRRGILQSIASKNEHDPAMEKLRSFGLDEFFLYPQISWERKSTGIGRLSKSLDVPVDAFGFIDDDPFERDEVLNTFPGIQTFDATDLGVLFAADALVSKVTTEDGRRRRLMYQRDIKRKQAEEEAGADNSDFLSSLGLVLTISRASEEDLDRAEELTIRTHQLNTTGRAYSREELNGFINSHTHELLITGLEDKYGPYGRVGLLLLECHPHLWTIQLFLTSCRVISRGIGGVLLHWLAARAKARGVRLQGTFVPNDRNRIMWITYHFANFREIGSSSGVVILANDLSRIQSVPSYIALQLEAPCPIGRTER